jgi:hypothetical protein
MGMLLIENGNTEAVSSTDSGTIRRLSEGLQQVYQSR